MNRFLVVAAADKISALQAEAFFADHKAKADRKASRRVLNRADGKPPRRDDTVN